MIKKSILAVAIGLIAIPTYSQVGLFDKQADWEKQGNQKIAGSATVNGDTYNVKGNGNDIWGTADEGFYVYKDVTDSFQLTTKVKWISDGKGSGSGEWAKAGIMVRENGAAANSRNYFLMTKGYFDRSIIQVRTAAGVDTDNNELRNEDNSQIFNPDGLWFRVSYYAPKKIMWGEVSTDGTEWLHKFTTGVEYASPFAVGFAVTNHEDNDQLAEAEFSNVSFNTLTTVPASILNEAPVGSFTTQANIGAVNRKGTAVYDAGSQAYTLSGNGEDIWNRRDNYNYLFKEMTGNFEAEISTLLLVPANADWTKMGLMVRKNLSWGSPYGFAMTRSDGQFQLAGRSSAGVGASDNTLTPTANMSPDAKIKLVRVGNIVAGYYLDANNQWQLNGYKVVDIGDKDPFLFGLAITSNNAEGFAEGEFSSLQVTEYDWGVSRDLPGSNWSVGGTVSGIKLSVNVKAGKTVSNMTVLETVPDKSQASNIKASVGTATLNGNTITWTLPSVTDTGANLTYDLAAPTKRESNNLAWSATNLSATVGNLKQLISGDNLLSVNNFFIFDGISYPDTLDENLNLNKNLGSITYNGQAGGRGWSGNWTVGTNENVVLSDRIIDAGLMTSQPQEWNPGNLSVKLTGEVNAGGAARSIPTVSSGDFWLSYTFLDEGPAANHWSGITLFNAAGAEVSFIGKPYNASFAGIGNLPGGDDLTTVDYKQPNHFLVRIVINPAAGSNNDHVYLWVNPDETDRVDSYDADGADDISDITTLKLRRGTGSGSAYFDNFTISSDPALPPKGSARVDLTLNDPNRPAGLPVWDVISMDQVDDSIMGQPGFGHDPGEDYYLIVNGYIYFSDTARTTQIVGFGLPQDHISGLNGHILGPFNFAAADEGLNNAVKFENNDAQRGPFTFNVVPKGQYEEIRALMTSPGGDGGLKVTFNYEDGTISTGVIHADDWYDDASDNNIRFPDTLQLVDGMDRLDNGKNYQASKDPAAFQDTEIVDSSKVLVSVTLEFDTSVNTGNAFNLFSIIAIPAGADEPTSVVDWMLQ